MARSLARSVPSLAIVVAEEPPGHPIELRLRALREGGWDAKVVPSLRWRRRRDVVHLPGALAPAAVTAAKETGARIVVGFCGDEFGAVLEQPEDYQEVWRLADLIHVESDALRELAVRLGAPASPAVVPPVATALSWDDTPADGSFRILSGGPLTWAGGYEYALRAVRLLLDRGVRSEYRIVGGGPFLDAIEFARHQLGLEREVQLDGGGCAEVFLDAAIAPVSPKPVLDALASGLAVVSTKPLGPALVVPKRDPEAIAGALGRLATDERLRRRLGEEGRRFASAFDLERQVRSYVELYTAAASVTSAASASIVQSSATEESRSRKRA
jgi:glycosyltransferase involved in cell wall biosynthesis